jgi:hypothetical protein
MFFDMSAKRPGVFASLKKHWAPAASAEDIRRAAGISDKRMRQIRARLKAHGVIKKDATGSQEPGRSRARSDTSFR